jgi:hypothetical protein
MRFTAGITGASSLQVTVVMLFAAAVVLLGLCLQLGLLARCASDCLPVTWRHVAITAVLSVASAVLTTCMIS